MYIPLSMISQAQAVEISRQIRVNGYPSENRFLILSPDNQENRVGSIIMPGTVKEGLPRKGVVVQLGELTVDYKTFTSINVGDIVTYGLYAGKEVDFDISKLDLQPEVLDIIKNSKFSVLSASEIIYIEYNK